MTTVQDRVVIFVRVKPLGFILEQYPAVFVLTRIENLTRTQRPMFSKGASVKTLLSALGAGGLPYVLHRTVSRACCVCVVDIHWLKCETKSEHWPNIILKWGSFPKSNQAVLDPKANQTISTACPQHKILNQTWCFKYLWVCLYVAHIYSTVLIELKWINIPASAFQVVLHINP